MKKIKILLLLGLFLFAACSRTKNQPESNLTIDEILDRYQQQQSGEGLSGNDEEDTAPTSGPTCYQDGDHPIAMSIAGQFSAITTYEEVMVWFCNGAEFEDILNALATEEITNIDADPILKIVATGYTWDEIWLELGVTEE